MRVVLLLVVMIMSASGQAETIDISIGDFGFGSGSAPVTIQVGDTVRWTNTSRREHHSVRSGFPGHSDGLFGSGELHTGGTYSHQFNNPGNFPYHCGVHSNKPAQITVEGPVGRGDVNGDGVVNQQDVLVGLRLVGGLATMRDNALAELDVHPTVPDGAFDVLDVLRIWRWVSGADTKPL